MVAKIWCMLCCTVQALLWLEFIPLITYMYEPINLPGYSLLTSMFIALLLPVIIWLLLKPLIVRAQQFIPLRRQLQQSKFNVASFNSLLTGQPKYTQPDEEWSIVLGNKDSSNVITMVTNPYCPPCADTHKLLHKLLEQRSDVQARIVFTAKNTDSDLKTPVSRHLMSLYGSSENAVLKHALYDWYERKQKSYDAWAKVYPIQLNEQEYNKINRQKEWCELVDIKVTPTLLLNGYILPEMYLLSDLKYMLQYH